jgi:hypothetical protein
VGLIVSAVFIYRRFRVLIGLTSMIKLAGASLLLYLILDFFKVHGPLFILCFVGGMGFFMLLLFLFKEIRLSEIHDFIGFGNRKNLKSLKSESFPMDES